MGMTSKIAIWEDNPQKDRISKVVRIEFPYKTDWCIFSLEEIKQIIQEWIKGEELKYPLDQDVGLHSGDLRGRWMFFKFIKDIFDNYDPKAEVKTE